MDIVIPVAVATLAVLALLYPLVRPPLLAIDDAIGHWSKLALLEERKQILYGAIRETSFDFHTDKIGEDDYRREIDTLKREAIGVVAEIEALRSQAPRADQSIEKSIAAARDRMLDDEGSDTANATPDDDSATAVASTAATSPEGGDAPAGRFCTSCGHGANHEDRFCAACGAGLKAT